MSSLDSCTWTETAMTSSTTTSKPAETFSRCQAHLGRRFLISNNKLPKCYSKSKRARGRSSSKPLNLELIKSRQLIKLANWTASTNKLGSWPPRMPITKPRSSHFKTSRFSLRKRFASLRPLTRTEMKNLWPSSRSWSSTTLLLTGSRSRPDSKPKKLTKSV